MRKKYIETLVIIFMIAIVVILSYKLVVDDEPEKPYQIAVIVQDSQNDRWAVMKEGMEQAAEKYNMKLQFSTTSPFCSSNDLWSLASSELDNGVDGIVISPLGKPEEDRAESFNGIPIVLFGSDMAIENSYACIHADDAEIGRTIGDALYKDYGKALASMRIGVVSGPVTESSMNERLQGLVETLKEHGASVEWSMGLGASLERALLREMTEESYDTDIIVALGNQETETVAECVLNCEVETAVYGEGYSQKAVHYLDNGKIACLVLSNDFVMGYNGIELLANQMRLNDIKDNNQELGIWCVHRYDMYSDENVKVLFPIAQ